MDAPIVRFASADDTRLPDLAPPHWREKAVALRSPAAARLELVVGGLLFDLLSPFLPDVRPDDLSIAVGEHGKPYLPNAPHLHFNLSHTPGLAMAVVASSPVGCDVESTTRPIHSALARRAFSPAYCDRLFALPEPDRPAEFFRLWTLKEASLKALGIGFRTNPDPAALARVSAHAVSAPAPYAAAVALLSP